MLITDEGELEEGIYKCEELQSNIVAKIAQLQYFVCHSTHSSNVPPVTTASRLLVTTANVPPATAASELPVTTKHSSSPTPRGNVESLHIEDTQHQTPTVPLSTTSKVTQTQVSGFSISCLPKLNILFFTGDPLTWQPFWDSFDAAIHSNPMLSNIQKLTYLRAQLEGEAFRLSSHQ